jgi:hypothetical protein
MKDLWSLIKKVFSTLITAFVIVVKVAKYLLVKCFRYVLIILGAMFGIKLAKQAISKEE